MTASYSYSTVDQPLRPTPGAMVSANFAVAGLGGDTKVVGNFEYRIPLVKFVTLALFTDAGLDRTSFAGQLRKNPGASSDLPEMMVPSWSAHVRMSHPPYRDPQSMLRLAVGFSF